MIKFLCFLLYFMFFYGDVYSWNIDSITPSVAPNDYVPDDFLPSNDLRCPKNVRYCKQTADTIRVFGYVVNHFGVPVSGAKVQIWQADDAGCIEGEDISNEDNNDICNEFFVGNGTVVTNNLGYYEFYTIYPGSFLNKVPHISFRVVHNDFEHLYTQMFFHDNSVDNSMDPDFRAISSVLTREKLLSRPSTGRSAASNQYNFNIVLEGHSKYKNY